MTSNERDIREYLLGGLAAEEQELVELRMIEDDDYGIEALAVEDRLIESYLDGELSDDESKRFRSNYLTSDARVKRVKEFVALRAVLVANRTQTSTVMQEAGGGFFAFLRGFGPATAYAGAAVLLIAIAGAWFLSSTAGPTQLEQEYAKLNESDMNDLTKFASTSSVELTPGTYRSGDPGTKVATSTLTDKVLFRLPLMFESAPEARFDVALIRDGKSVFTIPGMRPVSDRGGSELRVLFPKTAIQSGQYQISLTQPGTSLAPVNYAFTAE